MSKKEKITNDATYDTIIDIICLTGKLPENIEEVCEYAHEMIMSGNENK